VEVSLKGREAIRQYIAAIPKAEWPERARDLTTEISERLAAREIDRDTYLVWREVIDARLDRHRIAGERDHDRFEGQSADFEPVNSVISAVVANLPQTPDRVALLPPERPRRNAARSQREIRADAHFRLKQAKLAKCPADVWGWYAQAHQSALSIALLDIYEHGECVRPIKLIAQCAGISDRSVQAMLRWATERGDLKVEERICPETRRTIPSRITTESSEILDYQGWVRRREQTQPLAEPSSSSLIDGPLRGEGSITHSNESVAVERPAAPPEAVEEQPHEAQTIEIAVLEAPEPVQKLEPDPVDDPLPDEEFEAPPLITYRPSWQPKWSAEEYAARHPKPAPVQVEHHEPINDRLDAALALVQGHARGSPPVENERAHRIEQPDVHVPMNDRWAQIAAEVAAHAAKRDEPGGSK
jgi:hypothetical protein